MQEKWSLCDSRASQTDGWATKTPAHAWARVRQVNSKVEGSSVTHVQVLPAYLQREVTTA